MRHSTMTSGLLVAAAVALMLAPAYVHAGIPAIAIPSQPGQSVPNPFEGAPATPNPVASFGVPEHPFMAPNGRSNMHHDAYMTDAYDWSGPLGNDLQVSSTWLGLEECASITFDGHGRIVGLCGSLDGAHLRMLDPVSLETLAFMMLPPRMLRPGTTPLTDFCAAGYFYLDHRDRGIVSTNTNQVWVLSIGPEPLFTLEHIYDLNQHVAPPDCIASVLPDWSGLLWFVSKGGVVGTIDPTSGVTASTTVGEGVFNSFAVDETGGVFIVTAAALYRFDADADGAPQVTWRETYDRGAALKPGMLSQGSGTSPTLLGDDLVAIADNADPMNIEVYRRGAAPEDERLVCSVPVFEPGASATENSLIAAGNSLIVENNYGYENPFSTANGATTAAGIARVDFDVSAETCSVAWTSSEVAPTNVPKMSLANGLIYVYAKPARADGVDAWYFTAIDFHTGATVYRQLTGTGYLYNNHYAPVSIGPDGTAYVGALGGLIRIADGA